MNSADLHDRVRLEIETGVKELLSKMHLEENDLFVVGCSTSEIQGIRLGQDPNQEIGNWVISALLDVLIPRGINLAVQGGEEINRALLVERFVAKQRQYEIVSVIPSLQAGGAAQTAAYDLFKDPVEVEHITAEAGMDIGDTAIGMHVKFVQIPFRTSIQTVGQAHTTYLGSRPKFIGGERAIYHKRTRDLPPDIIPMKRN
ncbi:ywlG [Furfurilactobacillus rossiae]|uniref:TIGR01440 family protein n=1 Tax=Furfurilactobacillus rossiae TaxID=231049 RepID=UPI0015BC7818|nr:TIGR01440 family protein [Furfurilactobacillus rossiae]MCF6165766.1 TIGR01440 family protein [Furfurilactobacillus rossiae]QLE63110.1 ywlG [Furfurilactobacillus rossiae]